MKLLLVLLTVLATGFANNVPPAAVARLCGNWVIHDDEKDKAINLVKRQGCSEVRMIELEDGYYLVYGVKVLRSESSESDPVSDTLDSN